MESESDVSKMKSLSLASGLIFSRVPVKRDTVLNSSVVSVYGVFIWPGKVHRVTFGLSSL